MSFAMRDRWSEGFVARRAEKEEGLRMDPKAEEFVPVKML